MTAITNGSIQSCRFPPDTEKPARLSGWLLDVLADEKLMGGYVGKRHRKCPTCQTLRASNGECLCQ